ncbi:Alpha/Beta hydrolase protein [Chaetomium tenue]|uniref:Alpha/Beta hydrolase protein n=1 Tax=Chaetomium tenue TaxID=1854479 RepID=A0ACB7P7D5_9PEZI|nr:Alpha/Beta hydrolase protein [Chaetomium globosum]
MPVPFLGRLNITEYVALVGSFLLVGLEAFIRIFTLALPSSLLELCYGVSRRLFNRLASPAQKRAERRRKSISTSIRNASDFVDLCAAFGYTAEEHVVQTKDGYLLGLHRLAWKKGEEDVRVNRGPNSVKKRVVYLHHGLLMNSEVWVCLTDEQRALPFTLVEKGFDVWFGNNRGNKYSKKSIHSSPTSLKFWNFSIDEFAFHDIPDSISYILETTGQQSLSYIGFSQGTAQAFASLAVHPKLNDQVNVFIALAPAMSPAGLSNGIVDALVKASPQVLYLLFGRRSILSSATMWESILYPPLFTKVIDMGLSFLFAWRTQNISTSQKLAAYPHLYSFTSTKSVVHWFQIIRTKSFQMYDDDVHPPLGLSPSASRYTKVAKYPTRNIKTPIVLVYGGSDSLVDIRAMLRELPAQTLANEIPHYEHLDFLWARDVHELVFPHVFDALESFTGAEHTREEYARYQIKRQSSSLLGVPPTAVAGGKKKKKTMAHLAKGGDVVDSDVSTAVGGGSNHGDDEEEEDESSEVGGAGNEEEKQEDTETRRQQLRIDTQPPPQPQPPAAAAAAAPLTPEPPAPAPPAPRARTQGPRVPKLGDAEVVDTGAHVAAAAAPRSDSPRPPREKKNVAGGGQEEPTPKTGKGDSTPQTEKEDGLATARKGKGKARAKGAVTPGPASEVGVSKSGSGKAEAGPEGAGTPGPGSEVEGSKSGSGKAEVGTGSGSGKKVPAEGRKRRGSGKK